MTKLYNVAVLRTSDDKLSRIEVFGSVTEVCNYLDECFELPKNDTRKRIVSEFGVNKVTWIKLTNYSIRISQHRVEVESRLHKA